MHISQLTLARHKVTDAGLKRISDIRGLTALKKTWEVTSADRA